MKKIYFTLVCLMMSISSVFAQGNVVFTMGDGGEVLADGATITANHLTEDPFMGSYIHSGLWVKNNGTGQAITVEMAVETLPASTAIQICFPSNCQSFSAVGTYETNRGGMAAGASMDLQTEWFVPATYDKAKATYRIKYYSESGKDALGMPTYSFSGYGPSVTVIYDYADPAGIDAIEGEKEISSVKYYSILGRQMPVAKGLCIKKTIYADGTQKCVKIVAE